MARTTYPGLTKSEARSPKYAYCLNASSQERTCIVVQSHWHVTERNPNGSVKESYETYQVKDALTGEVHTVDTRSGYVRRLRPSPVTWAH